MKKIISVAVLGSTGFVGLELVKLLIKHPNVKINFLGCEKTPNREINFFEKKIDISNIPLLDLNENFISDNCDVVFLALPHSISNNYVKKLYKKIRIIDLSADFRLDNYNDYKLNYGNNHTCPNLLNKFIYGLPEIYRDKILENFDIAVPGCYPTSILLPLIPLIKNNLINLKNIIIDSKSGYSGAGKKFDKKNINNEKDLNFYNYNTNEHRHISEIQQELNKFTKEIPHFSFNPHILPVFRGMMSTIYCDLNKNIKINDLKNTLNNFTKNLPFVDFLSSDQKIDLFSVQNTNKCLIKLFNHQDESKIIIVSIIDNLIKGAAGQAIQCFNINNNLNEELSLI